MVDIFYVSEIVTGSLICRRITLIIQKNLILSNFRLSIVSLPGGGAYTTLFANILRFVFLTSPACSYLNFLFDPQGHFQRRAALNLSYREI